MEPFASPAGRPDLHGTRRSRRAAAAFGLSAVVDVHGGPRARDTWGFNPEAQWLANRGYVCIQVNYRGSTGYGKDSSSRATVSGAPKCTRT